MKKNISFCLKIGKLAKVFVFLFAMIPFVACNDDKVGCDRALLDMVNHFNSDLPETLTKGLTASRLTVDDNNLNFVLSVDERYMSVSSVVQKIRTNRDQFTSFLLKNNETITPKEQKEIRDKYRIRGKFSNMREYIQYLLKQTGRGVAIQVQGSKHRDMVVAATYTVDEL